MPLRAPRPRIDEYLALPNLLIVANCPSANTHKLKQSVSDGARHADIKGVQTRVYEPLECGADEVLWADALILGTTENFGYMSGLVKDFFERIYYPCLEKTEGLPVAVYIKGGLDGEGAKNSVERILQGLKWKRVQPTLVLTGNYCEEFATQCKELGMLMAAGLESGVF